MDIEAALISKDDKSGKLLSIEFNINKTKWVSFNNLSNQFLLSNQRFVVEESIIKTWKTFNKMMEDLPHYLNISKNNEIFSKIENIILKYI